MVDPGAVAIARDVTGRKRAEAERARLLETERAARSRAEVAQQRLALLAEASAVLAGSLDYATTLRQVARLAVSQLADWCTVDLVDDDGVIRRVAAAHADPAKEALLHEVLRRYPMELDEPRGVAIALRTGQTQVQPVLTDEDLKIFARDARHLAILRELAPRSSVSVPLVARGRRLGVLAFTLGDADRRYTAADLPFAEDLAGRAAVAIDNARLYGEAQEAEERYRAVVEHSADPIVIIRGASLVFANHAYLSTPRISSVHSAPSSNSARRPTASPRSSSACATRTAPGAGWREPVRTCWTSPTCARSRSTSAT
jgi:PAS domain-containing protein